MAIFSSFLYVYQRVVPGVFGSSLPPHIAIWKNTAITKYQESPMHPSIHPYSYGPLPVISTYNPIYNMCNPTYNQL